MEIGRYDDYCMISLPIPVIYTGGAFNSPHCTNEIHVDGVNTASDGSLNWIYEVIDAVHDGDSVTGDRSI